MDNSNYLIGNNLREIRKQRQLTLDELSELTGVSKSMLSALERGVRNPTLNILIKINSGLKIPLTDIFQNKSLTIEGITRSDEMSTITHDNGYLVRSIINYNQDHPLEIFEQFISPHSRHDSDAQIGESILEFLIPVKGNLTLVINESTFIINEGELIWFSTDRPNSYINNSDKDIKVIMIVYYKQ